MIQRGKWGYFTWYNMELDGWDSFLHPAALQSTIKNRNDSMGHHWGWLNHEGIDRMGFMGDHQFHGIFMGYSWDLRWAVANWIRWDELHTSHQQGLGTNGIISWGWRMRIWWNIWDMQTSKRWYLGLNMGDSPPICKTSKGDTDDMNPWGFGVPYLPTSFR